MPIYEFACADCGHGFERLQKLSDADPVDCPSCARPSVRRRLSAPSFRLAGAGWYETDFKGEGDRKRNLAGGDDGAAKPASDKGGETPVKTDSKTDGKPESKTESKAPATAAPASSAAAV